MTLIICSATQDDQAHVDFSTFYQNELKHAKLSGSKFKDKDRLDDFNVKELCALPSKELSFVIKIIPTMSHGQAAMERGLKINNSALNINISLEGVIVKRLVKYHLLANNLKLHTIQITNPMVSISGCMPKSFFCIVFKLLSLKFSFLLPSLFKIERQRISSVNLLDYFYAYAFLVVNLLKTREIFLEFDESL